MEVKNMKPNYLLCLFAVMFIIMIGGVGVVSAVECNADLSQGGNSCTVSSSLTLNGSYVVNMNGSSGNAIRINSDNLVFDCNGTIIYGNWSSGASSTDSRGISFNGNKQNVTIKNCNVNNYWASYKVLSNFNTTFNNVTSNSSYHGFYLIDSVNSSVFTNVAIYNVLHIGIIIKGSYNNVFDNVLVSNNTQDKYSFYIYDNSQFNYINNSNFYGNIFKVFSSSKNNTVTNSNFYYGNASFGSLTIGSTEGFSAIRNSFYSSSLYGNDSFIFGEGASNILIDGNRLVNLFGTPASWDRGVAIGFNVNSVNVTVQNNYIDNVDLGIFFSKSSNFLIKNNTILNAFTNVDNYNTGIVLGPGYTNNFIIDGNNITNFGSGGMAFQNATNGIIRNNYLYGLQNQFGSNYYDINEPQEGMGFYELYKGFTGQGNNYEGYQESNISVFRSNNISLSNNTILGVSILIRNSNSYNISILNDFNYVFKSFKPSYLSGRYDLYLNPNYQNISRINLTYSYLTNGQVASQFNSTFQYEYYQGYDKYTNLMGSILPNVSINYLTSALLTNGTSLCNGSSSNLALNSGQINITLNPSEACWVFDNYNLNEASPRVNSPIWITESKDTGKQKNIKIANNLTQITVPVYISTINCYINQPIMYPKSSAAYHPTCSCSDNILYCSNIILDTSTSSNELVFTYYEKITMDICNNFFNAGVSFTSFIAIIIIIAIAGIITYFLFGGLEDTSELSSLAIIVLIGSTIMILGMKIISTIGGC